MLTYLVNRGQNTLPYVGQWAYSHIAQGSAILGSRAVWAQVSAQHPKAVLAMTWNSEGYFWELHPLQCVRQTTDVYASQPSLSLREITAWNSSHQNFTVLLPLLTLLFALPLSRVLQRWIIRQVQCLGLGNIKGRFASSLISKASFGIKSLRLTSEGDAELVWLKGAGWTGSSQHILSCYSQVSPTQHAKFFVC